MGRSSECRGGAGDGKLVASRLSGDFYVDNGVDLNYPPLDRRYLAEQNFPKRSVLQHQKLFSLGAFLWCS